MFWRQCNSHFRVIVNWHEIDYDLEGLFGDIEFNGELVEHLILRKEKEQAI